MSKKASQFSFKKSSSKKFVKKRLYETIEWSEYRVIFLQANPKCYACGKSARVIDHIVSAKGDEDKFFDPTNLMPLCKEDHDFITGKFDRHVVAKTEDKMKWIQDKRIATETTVRVKVIPFKHK